MGKVVELIGKYVVVVAVCFVLIWILYFLNTFNMPAEKIQDIVKSVLAMKEWEKYPKRS
jgi:hypothetical protein